MGVAPIGAIKKVLDRAGMTIDDVDVVELNEAFAAQVIPIMSECDIPLEKLNPHGGAIALGHPFGMTGARIMTTLLNDLETDDKTIGLETMCVAGGQGEAMHRRAPELTHAAGSNRHQLVFVGGLHRSGTTFLWRCLAEHPHVSAFANTGVPREEGQFLQTVYPTARAYGGPARFGLKPAAHLTEQSPLVSPANRARLFAEWSSFWDLDKPVLLEKSPPNLIHARFLQALFPEAFFVMIMRHPVAVSYSLARRFGKGLRMTELLRHWVVCHDLFAADRAHLERVHVVRYEAMVGDLRGTIASLHRFLGVEAHPVSGTSNPTATSATSSAGWAIPPARGHVAVRAGRGPVRLQPRRLWARRALAGRGRGAIRVAERLAGG